MRYGSRPPEWPSGLFQPRRTPLAHRAARAAASGAGRAVAAGGKRAYARRRPGMPLLVALLAHLTGAVLWLLCWLGVPDYTATVDLLAGLILLAVAAWSFAPHWLTVALGSIGIHRKARRWPLWRQVYLGIAAVLLLAYLPAAAWWTPGPPVLYVSTSTSLGMWLWLYLGHYRIREVEEPEPVEGEYGPVEIWDEEIGAAGKLLPGSVLTDVHNIEAPA